MMKYYYIQGRFLISGIDSFSSPSRNDTGGEDWEETGVRSEEATCLKKTIASYPFFRLLSLAV
jgi:hypothetical protein